MKKFLHIRTTIFLTISAALQATPVLIIVPCYNRPNFIEWQNKLFKKFLADDYKMVVFNDAQDPTQKQLIEQTCKEQKVEHVIMPQEKHLSRDAVPVPQKEGYRHAEVLNFALQTIGYTHQGIVVLFDGDLLLTQPISFSKLLGTAHIIGYKRTAEDWQRAIVQHKPFSEIYYLWPGIVILNMPLLPEKNTLTFYPTFANDKDGLKVSMDTGGTSYFYLEQHKDVHVKWLARFWEPWPAWLPVPQQYDPQHGYCHTIPETYHNFVRACFPIYGSVSGYFLHYGAVSGWDKNDGGEEFHKRKMAIYQNLVDYLLTH